MHWTDDLHSLLLQLSGALNRPELDEWFLSQAGIKLDRALFPLLSRISVLGPIGTVELAAQVGRDHSTVSRQLTRLEQLDLICRKPADDDGRVRLLRTTAKGRRLVAALAATRRRLMSAKFRSWTEADRAMLIRLLRRLIEERD